jgi:hypothetical protein
MQLEEGRARSETDTLDVRRKVAKLVHGTQIIGEPNRAR